MRKDCIKKVLIKTEKKTLRYELKHTERWFTGMVFGGHLEVVFICVWRNLFSIQAEGSFCEAVTMEDPIMMETVFEKGPFLSISSGIGFHLQDIIWNLLNISDSGDFLS